MQKDNKSINLFAVLFNLSDYRISTQTPHRNTPSITIQFDFLATSHTHSRFNNVKF